MNIGETLRESAEGILAWVTNELRVYARNNDQVKVRVGSPGDHGGCVSFNKIWLDENNRPINEEELGLLQIKQDERTRDNPDGARAELTIHLNDGQGRKPDSLVPVLLIRTDGYTFLVPPNGSPEHGPDNPPAPPPSADDAFAAQVRAWYHDMLFRDPSAGEIDAHRGNPSGLQGVYDTIIGSAEYKAKH